MSINSLNDISKVYLEQIIESTVPGKPAERLGAVTAIPKSEQDAARERTLAKAKAMRDKKGIKEEDRKVGGGVKKGGGYERGYEAMKREIEKLDKGEEPATRRRYKEMRKESLDPVGKEDADIDIEEETKAERYKRLMATAATPAQKKAQERQRKGREVLADIQATEKALKAGKKSPTETKPEYNTPESEVRVLKPGQKKDTLALKAKKAMSESKKVKKWWDDDGDGKGYEEGEVSGKFAKKKKNAVKEGYSNWREDLSEVITDKQFEKKITEKKVNNKVTINPKLDLGEAVENLGGTLLEMIEVDEMDYIVESVYDELLDEGYEEDDIEEALEFALTEAKVTFGHDTTPKGNEKKRGSLLAAAKQKLSGVKKAAKQAVASGARKVAKGALGVARKMEKSDSKPSAAHQPTIREPKRPPSGAGQKEKLDSGSYTPPTKKKQVEKSADPWEGSATTPAKPKAKPKAKSKTTKVSGGTTNTPTRKKKSKLDDLDDLLSDIRKEEVQIYEKTLTTAETKKKEELVKSMKKNLPGFKSRYGERAKEVMYATATKMAKKIAEQATEIEPKVQKLTQQDTTQKRLSQQKDRQKQQEVQILQRKLQALRSAPKGVDADITAGYNPEGELVNERTRYAKETGKSFTSGKSTSSKGTLGGDDTHSKVMRHMHKVMGAGRMGAGGAIQPRGKKKVPGQKPPKAGEYRGPVSPAQKVAKRRAVDQRAQNAMSSRFD